MKKCFTVQSSKIQKRVLTIGLLLILGVVRSGSTPTAAAQSSVGNELSIQISQETATLMAGDWVAFHTVLQNDSATATPPLAVHLSVADVKSGRHVDPEDWSPQRTQYVQLQPGESVQLNWRLHALFEGEFATFLTVLSPERTFVPLMSSPLQLQVTPDNILPLRTVIPVVAVVPIFPLGLLLVTVLNRRKRRHK